jgi:hypothetical protein
MTTHKTLKSLKELTNNSITLFYKLRNNSNKPFLDTLDFTVDNPSTSYRVLQLHL